MQCWMENENYFFVRKTYRLRNPTWEVRFIIYVVLESVCLFSVEEQEAECDCLMAGFTNGRSRCVDGYDDGRKTNVKYLLVQKYQIYPGLFPQTNDKTTYHDGLVCVWEKMCREQVVWSRRGEENCTNGQPLADWSLLNNPCERSIARPYLQTAFNKKNNYQQSMTNPPSLS